MQNSLRLIKKTMKKNHKQRTYSITIEATEDKHVFVRGYFESTVKAMKLNNFGGISFISDVVVKEGVK